MMTSSFAVSVDIHFFSCPLSPPPPNCVSISLALSFSSCLSLVSLVSLSFVSVKHFQVSPHAITKRGPQLRSSQTSKQDGHEQTFLPVQSLPIFFFFFFLFLFCFSTFSVHLCPTSTLTPQAERRPPLVLLAESS